MPIILIILDFSKYFGLDSVKVLTEDDSINVKR